MAFIKKSDGGIFDAIRCDETDYLIWKWHPKGIEKSNTKKANAIRWGSSLRVRDGSVAVFVYPQENGKYQDFFEGPFDEIIKTLNFPVLSGIIGKFYDGSTPFQAEVYFINLAKILQIRFGIPYFDVFDPRFQDYPVPTAVRGSISFCISDYREFIKLHRLDDFDIDSLRAQIKDIIIRDVKSVVMNAPDEYGIQVNQLEKQIVQINNLVESKIRSVLQSDFGINVTRVDISDIEIDKNSKGYQKIISITQNKLSVFAQAATSIVDTVSMHRAGTRKVVKNRKNTVKEKNSENKRGILRNGFIKKDDVIPPPLPVTKYYIAINDKQEGPFVTEELKKLIQSQIVTEESLVWCKGMKNWEKAGSIKSLASIFEERNTSQPPKITKE